MRAWRRLGVLALCAVAFSGCTLVSTTSTPTLIDSNAVPLGLLDSTIPFTDYAQVHFVTREIFMVNRSQHVIPVGRLVTSPPSLAEVLYYVPLGPTANEQANGLTTEAPKMVVNLANIPNNNGRVGVWGISYPGFYATMTILSGHPALKAASPQAPVTEWFLGDDWRHNGASLIGSRRIKIDGCRG